MAAVVLAALDAYRAALACPRCGSGVALEAALARCTAPACRYATEPFPFIGGVPALVDVESSIVSLDELRASDGSSAVPRRLVASGLRRHLDDLLHPPNRVAEASIARLLELARADSGGRRPLVLVVGGGVVGSGIEALYDDPGVDVVAFDLYASDVTQLIADGHHIPLASASVDGVVVQAVLEHVLEPAAVVAEIHRVLRPGGLVYADTPFIQQVHEGAYDFTRFTESGHRYLLRDFDRLDSGAAAGAGTALAWSIDYFVRALCRSQRAGFVARLAFSWLARLDGRLDVRFSLDAASSVYFLGRKGGTRLSPRDLVRAYDGAQVGHG